MKKTLSFALVVFVCAVTTYAAVDLYVDPVNGDDANSGASWEAALKTITNAAQLATGQAASIHLAEGTFSEETGEVFPIRFSQLKLLSGQSYLQTVIDAGSSPTIVECSDYTREATLSSLSIVRQTPIPPKDISGAALRLHWGNAYFDQVQFLDFFNIPILEDVCAATFARCRFSGGRDCLFHLKQDASDRPWWLSMTDCVFDYSAEPEGLYSYYYPFVPDVTFLEINSCRFTSPSGRPEILFGLGSIFTISNCCFDGCDLFLETGTDWNPRGCIQGSSFRSSNLTLSLSEYCHWYVSPARCDIDLCALAPDCSFRIERADVSMFSCWLPLDPTIRPDEGNELRQEQISTEDPVFVYGPLGGCYLSNVDSGQRTSSSCLDTAPPGWWPGRFDLEPPPHGSTTRTDGIPDTGFYYDIGYHYPSVPPPPPSVVVETDRLEYAPGDEMVLSGSFENRGVLVEGGIYVALTPESLDWFMYWPSMGFSPTPVIEGNLYSGVAYPMAQFDRLDVAISLLPGQYYWLGAVIDEDGAFASDVSAWPVVIEAASS